MATTITLTNGRKRLDYSTKETADAIRAALKTAFPGVKFSVRTAYASMTSSTNIRWTDGPTQPEVETVTNRFTSKSFDGSDDSTHYHSQDLDGVEVQYSGWIHVTREISPMLLQKALDRYNLERAKFGAGPARLTVTPNGSHAYVAGPDQSTANPCGGRAMWCPDAVYHFAHTMRPNGVRVILKGSW